MGSLWIWKAELLNIKISYNVDWIECWRKYVTTRWSNSSHRLCLHLYDYTELWKHVAWNNLYGYHIISFCHSHFDSSFCKTCIYGNFCLLFFSGKITSPKWKQFRGMHMNVKEKIRVNNLIWREWYMQCKYITKQHM